MTDDVPVQWTLNDATRWAIGFTAVRQADVARAYEDAVRPSLNPAIGYASTAVTRAMWDLLTVVTSEIAAHETVERK